VLQLSYSSVTVVLQYFCSGLAVMLQWSYSDITVGQPANENC
jgi:hypothetical protein